jgi:hypothetical protein
VGGAVPTGMAGVAGTAAGSAEDAKVTPVMFLSWCPIALHCPSHLRAAQPSNIQRLPSCVRHQQTNSTVVH